MKINSFRPSGLLLSIYSLMVISFSLGTYFSVSKFAGGDIRIWEILLLVLLVLISFKILLTNKILVNSIPAIIFSIILIIFAYISVFNSIEYSLWIKRMLLFTLFMTLFIVTSYLNSKNIFKINSKLIIFSGVIAASWGIIELLLRPQELLQYGSFIPRANSFFEEANEFSQYLNLPFGFLLAQYIFNDKKTLINRSSIFLLLSIVIIAQFISFSRGGLLAFFSQLLLLTYIYNNKILLFKKILIASVFITIFFIIVISTFPKEYININAALEILYSKTVQTFSTIDASTSVRFHTIKLGLTNLENSINNLIFGIGLGSLELALGNLDADGDATTSNFIIDILVETGMLGLFSYLLFIIYMLYISQYVSKRLINCKDNNLKVVFYGSYFSIIGLMIGGLTVATHMHCFFWYICGLIFASYSIVKNNNRVLY